MRDYEVLINALNAMSNKNSCYYCQGETLVCEAHGCILSNAADAIEELLAELVTIRNQLPKWISVEDELPEENKQIISYLAYKGMAVLQYENKHFYMQGAFQPLPKEAVTHWMPLPEPPKGVE